MEIGWTELLVIGVVALIVIGPKDLPAMFRELGRFTAKMRRMGGEFSRAMEQAARETGVKDVADDLRNVASSRSLGLDAVKTAADKFEKWDPMRGAGRPGGPGATPKPVATPPAVGPGVAKATAAGAATGAAAGPATHGPATQALSEQRAAQTAIARDAADRMRAAAAPAAPQPAAPQPVAPRSAGASAGAADGPASPGTSPAAGDPS